MVMTESHNMHNVLQRHTTLCRTFSVKLHLRTADQRIVPHNSLLKLPIHLHIPLIIQHLAKMPQARIINQRRILPFSFLPLPLVLLTTAPLADSKTGDDGFTAVFDPHGFGEGLHVLEIAGALVGEVAEEVEHGNGTCVGCAEGANEVF